jgi:hypothetical protein
MTFLTFFTIAAAAAALALAALILDRMLLWAEDQGWIFYRRTRLDYRGGRSALRQLGAFFEPAKEHVIEVERRLEDRREDDGDSGRGSTRPTYDSVRESLGAGTPPSAEDQPAGRASSRASCSQRRRCSGVARRLSSKVRSVASR